MLKLCAAAPALISVTVVGVFAGIAKPSGAKAMSTSWIVGPAIVCAAGAAAAAPGATTANERVSNAAADRTATAAIVASNDRRTTSGMAKRLLSPVPSS